MQIVNQDSVMTEMLEATIALEKPDYLIITTLGGEAIKAYEPITMGRNFIMCKLGAPAAQHRSTIIPWAVIGSIQI